VRLRHGDRHDDGPGAGGVAEAVEQGLDHRMVVGVDQALPGAARERGVGDAEDFLAGPQAELDLAVGADLQEEVGGGETKPEETVCVRTSGVLPLQPEVRPLALRWSFRPAALRPSAERRNVNRKHTGGSKMAYAAGRVINDADSHIMESLDWLPSYAERPSATG
jgi:hypothetical protein